MAVTIGRDDHVVERSSVGNDAVTHDIVPAHLAVQAMRDSGYKNAAYALAELMDNSIQANATAVELLCGERELFVQQRKRSRIHQVAVLDNGCGMDASVLRMALQFGNGTRLSPDQQDGIGKFGMGLPSSSISQCTRVDVWSWQDGIESALHSYLDVEKIKSGHMREVPTPRPAEIPELWRTAGKSFGQSGTLVVWSNLDRVIWKTARSIIDNSEMLIGRMYRRFLEDGRVQIRMVAFDVDQPGQGPREQYALPNDPLYLMSNTSCPAPFDQEPMFGLWGEPVVMKVNHKGEKHPVRITFSAAKEVARSTPNAGGLPHGRHAAKNIGVSVMRAGRELDLEQSWTVQYDPRERWWGVEVEFPPALDDLFGVSNNKQSARNFHEIDVDSLLVDDETVAELKERLQEEEDPMGPLLEISQLIDKNLGLLRKLIDTQRKGERNQRRRHKDHQAEQIATTKTNERKTEGYRGESDDGESLPAEERTQGIKDELIRVGLSEPIAEGIAASTVDHGFKYTIVDAPLEGSAFFSVSIKAGAVIITLNMNHPAYHALLEALDGDDDAADAEALAKRLQNARNGLRLLLMAWARYEDELPSQRRTQTQDIRADWGRIARQFLEN